MRAIGGVPGASGLLAFGVDGRPRGRRRFIEAAQFMSHLANIGDTRTLIIHPASTTHRQLDEAQQLAAGVLPDMVRISVGLEHVDDILWDIDQALAASRSDERPLDRRKETAMFQPDLMAGQRILVTGGGTGLGRAMAERFLGLGADVAICGRRQAVCEETAAQWRDAVSRSAASTPSASTSATRRASRRWSRRCGTAGGLTGLVNNAAGNFIAPTESLSPRAFDAVANIVFHGTLLRHAGGRQALDRRGQGGPVAAGRAVPQRDEHHRHLGRQRPPVRRALGDEQGRRRGDDQVARDRVGALRHPAQRGRRPARSRPRA